MHRLVQNCAKYPPPLSFIAFRKLATYGATEGLGSSCESLKVQIGGCGKEERTALQNELRRQLAEILEEGTVHKMGGRDRVQYSYSIVVVQYVACMEEGKGAAAIYLQLFKAVADYTHAHTHSQTVVDSPLFLSFFHSVDRFETAFYTLQKGTWSVQQPYYRVYREVGEGRL